LSVLLAEHQKCHLDDKNCSPVMLERFLGDAAELQMNVWKCQLNRNGE